MKAQRTSLGRQRFSLTRSLDRLASLSVALVIAVLGATPLAAAHPEGTNDDWLWKDRFGNPLPFESDAEIIEFLRTAEIKSVEDLEVGITEPRRVELVKDGITVRAALRDFDETYEKMRFEREFYDHLRDSYVFDLAAYELSHILGLDNVPPVTLRRVNGVEATLQIWLEDALVEWDRFEQEIMPPDELWFHKQRQNMLVFDSVIGNVDRNNGNILYDEEWNHWLIDHSRSFLRDAEKMPYLEQINWCSRHVYDALQRLDRDILRERLSPPLEGAEINALLMRRDKVLTRLDALIAERGETAVLF